MSTDENVLTWALGRVPAPGPDDVARAVEAAEEDEDGFFVLERPDGTFVQYDGARLEWGQDGRIWRHDVRGAAQAACARLLAGRPRDAAGPWREVTAEVASGARARRAGRRRLLLAALFAAGVAVLAWILLRRAQGG